MSKSVTVLALAILLLCVSCATENDETPEQWITEELGFTGDSPLPSPNGEHVLFNRESPTAGLILLETASGQLIPLGLCCAAVDYSWSHDGQKFAYTRANGGVFIREVEPGASDDSLWNLGSHPRFLPGDTLLVCNGPEDNEQHRGIYIIDLRTHARILVSDSGISPIPSPDGQKIGFLVSVAGVPGKTLLVYNRQTHFTRTLAFNVYSYSWLSDSETLVFETLVDGTQKIALTSFSAPSALVYDGGTRATGLPGNDSFAYTTIAADSISGVMLGKPGQGAHRIAEFGINIRSTSNDILYAQGRNGLIRIHKQGH